MKTGLINKQIIIDYIFLTIGAMLMAIGIGVFLVDSHVVPGGVSGLAMAIHYLSNNKLPVGMLMWVLNIPLFIWGIIELGKKFGVRTFYGFTLSSFFIDFFRGDIPGFSYIKLNHLPAIEDIAAHDFFFLVLLGAVLLGAGLGIIFKFKGTTAGSDIVAAILHKRFGIKPGQAIMLIDFFVISLAGIVIAVKDLSPDKPAMALTLYALFLLFISSHLVDLVIDGFDYARMAYIISNKSDEIGSMIINEFGRGATSFDAKGLYTNIERDVIMTVITVKEVSELISCVKKIDSKAFIIINNVHEVLGEGFRRRI